MLVKRIVTKSSGKALILIGGLLVLIIIGLTSFIIIDSRLWKEKMSFRFNGVNLAESFASNREDLIEKVDYINPTTYRLELNNAGRGDIVSLYEDYDAYWYAREIGKDSRGIIISSPHRSNINNFRLREEGDYILEVFYAPQRWRDFAFVSSVLGFIIIGITLFTTMKVNKKRN